MKRAAPRRWRGVSAFTILEIMVTIMILSVLVSLALSGYQSYRDRAAKLVDETNEKVVAAAAKLYAYDNRFLPANLGQLRPEHLQRAYAMVTEGKQPYTFWAFLLEQVGLEKVAEAQTLIEPKNYLGANPLKILTCPTDATPPPGGRSYGIHPTAAGQPLSWLLSTANAGRHLIIETDDGTTYALRHRGRCVVTSAGGFVDRNYSGANGPGG